MRLLLALIALALVGCGNDHSVAATPPPPPAPFADIAGQYAAYLATSSGYFVTHSAAQFATITIDGQGTASATGGSVFHLTRNPDGSFAINPVSLEPSVTEQGTAPATLDHVTLTITAAGNPDGAATYVLTKFTNG